jgi:hypothetical protein
LRTSIRRGALKSIDESTERNIREFVCGASVGRMKRNVSGWLVKSGATYSNRLQALLSHMRGIGWRKTLILVRGIQGRGERIERGWMKF